MKNTSIRRATAYYKVVERRWSEVRKLTFSPKIITLKQIDIFKANMIAELTVFIS